MCARVRVCARACASIRPSCTRPPENYLVIILIIIVCRGLCRTLCRTLCRGWPSNADAEGDSLCRWLCRWLCRIFTRASGTSDAERRRRSRGRRERLMPTVGGSHAGVGNV